MNRQWQPSAWMLVTTWLAVGGVLSAPLWIQLGPVGLLLGCLGPVGLLTFKPGEQMLGKSVIAAVGLLVTLSIAHLGSRRWAGWGGARRVLFVVGLSSFWHLAAALLLLVVLAGLN